MTAFTAAQRAELRAACDRSKREALAWSRRARRERTAAVRAAEHARRAQNAKQIAAEIVGPPRPPKDHCQFCGVPTKGDVCQAHSDLEGTT